MLLFFNKPKFKITNKLMSNIAFQNHIENIEKYHVYENNIQFRGYKIELKTFNTTQYNDKHSDLSKTI